MFTAPNLYYNVMSRTDLYLLAMDLSGKKAEELREDEVYYDSCITYEMTPELYVAKGFNNGKRIGYKMNATKGFEIYDYTSTDGKNLGKNQILHDVVIKDKVYCIFLEFQGKWEEDATLP